MGDEEQKELEEVEKELEEACIIKPLDGGYGWLIVLASFVINLIVDGIIFTAGDIVLPSWKSDFNSSDTAVSLTMSILSGSYLLVGPIASALANLFGCRAIAISGAILSFFGFIVSTIAPQIFFLYVSFGLVGGIGFGLLYLPSIVIIAQYFNEKRSLATGLAVCGSGIGTTIFSMINPPIMGLLNNNWRLFLVYLAVCVLICIVAGLAFKPVQASFSQIQQVSKIAETVAEHKDSTNGATDFGTFGSRPRFNSNRPFLSTLELNAQKGQSNHTMSQRDLAQCVARESVKDLNRPLSKMDIFYTGSTTNLRQRSQTVTSHAQLADHSAPEEKTNQSSIYISTIGLPTQEGSSEDFEAGNWKRNLVLTLKSLLDTSLLYSPSFLILAFSGFLTLSCFYVPYNYLSKHLERIPDLDSARKGYPIALLGIINIIARIGCGWVADRPQVDALFVTNVCLIAAGIATCLVPFFSEYWMFLAFCIPFAFGSATFAALRSVICVDLFGLEKLSNAFGILLTFMGVGAIVGSPLAAFIKDITGNYNVSFYIMGTMMVLSGAICLPLRKLREWELKREANKFNPVNVELEKLE